MLISDTNNAVQNVPVQDQQLALCLLMELSVQRGTLNSLLDSVRLLMELSMTNESDRDNRFSTGLTQAPLVPLLLRFKVMLPADGVIGSTLISHLFIFGVLLASSQTHNCCCLLHSNGETDYSYQPDALPSLSDVIFFWLASSLYCPMH